MLLVLFGCAIGYAQNKNKVKIFTIDEDTTPIHYKWLGGESRTLTKMKLVYKKPDGFKEISRMECFKETPKLWDIFGCLNNELRSDDKQFLAFIFTYLPPDSGTYSDAINLITHGKTNSFYSSEQMYMSQIRATIISYMCMDKGSLKNWKDYLQYYPDSIVKSKFNADTVIRFSMVFEPQQSYKKKYKYADALFLQKKGRGFVNFYCFYTEQAKAKFDEYWEKIEGVLRYED